MNLAAQTPKKMHASVLRKILNTFRTDELESLIFVIKEEQQRRLDK